jgi:hypothetical protein
MTTKKPKRWERRAKACEYARIGKTKMDQWIAAGHVAAKKEPGGHSRMVLVDLNSIDEFYASMPDARDYSHKPQQHTD